MRTSTTLLVLSLIAWLPVQHANATTILQASAASSTGTGASNTVDQSGLSSSYTSLVDDLDIYLASSPTHGSSSGTFWSSDTFSFPVSLDFDLGGSFLVESFVLWGQGNTNGNPKDFSLFADDNAGFSSPTLLGNFTNGLNGTLSAAGAQQFIFTPTQVSYIRMTIDSNYDPPPVFSSTRVREVAFGVVPEPSTALLLSIGLVGLAVRQRSH